MLERRRTRRVPCELAATWRRGRRTVVAWVRDINADGLLLHVGEDIDLNHVMDLVVYLPDGPVEFFAVSRHVEQGSPLHNIGASIHAMSDDEKARWRGYCRSLTPAPALLPRSPQAASPEPPAHRPSAR